MLRLERELQNRVGPQARLDPQVASALSFDPPGLRLPSFALFSEPDAVARVVEEPFSPPASPPGSPRSRVSEKVPRASEDPDVGLQASKRSFAPGGDHLAAVASPSAGANMSLHELQTSKSKELGSRSGTKWH